MKYAREYDRFKLKYIQDELTKEYQRSVAYWKEENKNPSDCHFYIPSRLIPVICSLSSDELKIEILDNSSINNQINAEIYLDEEKRAIIISSLESDEEKIKRIESVGEYYPIIIKSIKSERIIIEMFIKYKKGYILAGLSSDYLKAFLIQKLHIDNNAAAPIKESMKQNIDGIKFINPLTDYYGENIAGLESDEEKLNLLKKAKSGWHIIVASLSPKYDEYKKKWIKDFSQAKYWEEKNNVAIIKSLSKDIDKVEYVERYIKALKNLSIYADYEIEIIKEMIADIISSFKNSHLIMKYYNKLQIILNELTNKRDNASLDLDKEFGIIIGSLGEIEEAEKKTDILTSINQLDEETRYKLSLIALENFDKSISFLDTAAEKTVAEMNKLTEEFNNLFERSQNLEDEKNESIISLTQRIY